MKQNMVTVNIPEEIGAITLVAVKVDPDSRCNECQWCNNYNSHSPVAKKAEYRKLACLCDSLQPENGEYGVAFRALVTEFSTTLNLSDAVCMKDCETSQPEPTEEDCI